MKKKDIGEVIVMEDFNDDENNDNSKINTFFRNLLMGEVLSHQLSSWAALKSMVSSLRIEYLFDREGTEECNSHQATTCTLG